MPLLRARCEACKQPLGDDPPATLSVVCPSCRASVPVRVAADGQPSAFDASFDPTRFLRWLASARAQMARGAIGVAVGSCPRCASALVVSSRDEVRLPCPHCQTEVVGPGAKVLVDQWPEPWTRVGGGGGSAASSSEYRVTEVDDRSGVTAGCAGCGAPTPPNDPATRCARCGAVVWVERPGPPEDPTPRRVQLGARVDGTREGRPFNTVVSLPQAEQMLRRDLMMDATATSQSSLLGVTGLGCAIAVAVAILLGVVIAIAVR